MSDPFQWDYFIPPYPITLKRAQYIPVYVAVFYKEFLDGRCLLQMHEPREEYPYSFGEVYRDVSERAEIICRLMNRETAGPMAWFPISESEANNDHP